jgi:hypothetical protein
VRIRRKPYKRNCEYCSNNFPTRSGPQKYCSRSCANKARKGIKYDRKQKRNKYHIRQQLRIAVIDRDGEKCRICPLGKEWNGKFLQLQLDHIDGNKQNNNLINLRLLCPNCHSQTETFASKNKTRKSGRADDAFSLEN